MVSTTRNQKKEIAHSKKSTAITKAAAAVTPNHRRKRHDKNNKNDENPMQHEQTDAEDQHDSPSRRRQPLAEQSVNNETSLDHRETRTEMDLLWGMSFLRLKIVVLTLLILAENLRLRQERDAALEHNSGAPETIQPIPKPNGEAGTRGFKLIDAMGLSKENQEEYKMYKAIQVCRYCISIFCYQFLLQRSVRTFVIRSGIDLTEDFKHIDTEKLCNVYKLVSHFYYFTFR